MAKNNRPKNKSLSNIVGDKEERKLQAQRSNKSVWAGLGLFGLVGWSIAVPTILGAAFGIWLDKNFDQDFSWTLSLLLMGLILGCLIAWNWVRKEDKEIHNTNKDGNE
ncbi:AtpZ/AtpI family protein [Arenibacter certesii]|uniref:F0F1 ATP synthase subunit n=1 Tax=Arenibacter certesii TaxID=228955 RepID=A0A918J067_9FLAO|nr:AtpZ/AtpI family protein [Arenibacter certesii]GGW41229.1 F0F1 ATP synthase subunit [Arenibacter certesii]